MAWIYICLGALAMALELVVPGGVVMCLGLAALAIGGVISLGWLESASLAFMLFAILAVVLVLPMQWFLKRISETGDSSISNIDEDSECFGQIVNVCEDVTNDSSKGRIRFQGSEWPAFSHSQAIKKGSSARIIGRDNLIWIIEPYQDLLSSPLSQEPQNGV
jgi:inner membrane protein